MLLPPLLLLLLPPSSSVAGATFCRCYSPSHFLPYASWPSPGKVMIPLVFFFWISLAGLCQSFL